MQKNGYAGKVCAENKSYTAHSLIKGDKMNYINNQPVKRDWVNRTKRMLDKAAPYIVATLAIASGYVLLYMPEIVTNGF